MFMVLTIGVVNSEQGKPILRHHHVIRRRNVERLSAAVENNTNSDGANKAATNETEKTVVVHNNINNLETTIKPPLNSNERYASEKIVHNKAKHNKRKSHGKRKTLFNVFNVNLCLEYTDRTADNSCEPVETSATSSEIYDFINN